MKNGEKPMQIPEHYPAALSEIIQAAERGGENDMKFIGKRLPELMKYSADAELAVDWARNKGLVHKTNGHIRAVAAAVFEQYKGHLTRDDHHALRHIKRHDSHGPAGFRAAFALWTHGERDENVENTLRKALNSKESVIHKHAEELLAQKEEKEKEKEPKQT